jgi:RimJ/RimL family protein N-acetyltransferase
VEIRDEELVLRPIAAGDAADIAAGLAEPETSRYMLQIPTPYTLEHALVWVERCEQSWRERTSCPFAIVEAATGAFLGSIELSRDSGSIGYWVAPGAQGRGVATRALRLLCGWARRRPLRLTTHPDNVASQRVAEKAGFQRVGTITEVSPFRDGERESILFELSSERGSGCAQLVAPIGIELA